jgi:hypothetical protein
VTENLESLKTPHVPVFASDKLRVSLPLGTTLLKFEQPFESPVPDPRVLFSMALRASLSKMDVVRFGLVLSASEATSLRSHIDHFRIKGWNAVETKLDSELTRLDFDCSFDLPDPRPAVSVVIPSYENTAEDLQRAIKSAGQALERAGLSDKSEIIISDDGSRPAAAEVLGSLKTSCGFRVRVLRSEKNTGVSGARNRGIQAARNRIVALLDGDDEFHPAFLRALVSQVCAGAEVAASDMFLPLTSSVLCAKLKTKTEIFSDNSFGSGIVLNLEGPAVSRIANRQPIYNPLFKICYEDWELNCLLHLAGAKISIVPSALYDYYRRPSGRDSRLRGRIRNLIKRLLPLSARIRLWLSTEGITG